MSKKTDAIAFAAERARKSRPCWLCANPEAAEVFETYEKNRAAGEAEFSETACLEALQRFYDYPHKTVQPLRRHREQHNKE